MSLPAFILSVRENCRSAPRSTFSGQTDAHLPQRLQEYASRVIVRLEIVEVAWESVKTSTAILCGFFLYHLSISQELSQYSQSHLRHLDASALASSSGIAVFGRGFYEGRGNGARVREVVPAVVFPVIAVGPGGFARHEKDLDGLRQFRPLGDGLHGIRAAERAPHEDSGV
jgi:hypothetical protein